MQGHGDGGTQNGKRDWSMPAPIGPTVYARGEHRVPRWPSAAPALLRALLPCACALCGRVQEQPVCAGCVADLQLGGGAPRCPRCALALPAGRPGAAEPRHRRPPCPACRLLPPPFDAAVTLADYRPPADALVLALKFRGTLALARWLGERLAGGLAARTRAEPATAGQTPAIVTAIPLGPQRLVQRGFNQSWEIARAIAAALRLPADAALLARRHDTPAQSSLPLAERHANLAGAFGVTRADLLKGRHVLLIDDVMTTGATLSEAAATLKRHGAAIVTAAVALRTPAPDG